MVYPVRVLLAAVLALASACAPTSNVDNTKIKHDFGANGDGFIDFIDMARNTTSCAGGGTVCSSSNPGKCDTGTVTCDGTRAMCTPDSTVQDCYDGPLGTAGVGMCASGTQACIGILGTCNGQIVPAAKEDCSNDLDDDCNGKVNNTCPDTLSVGVPRYVSPLAPTPPPNNANPISLEKRCPAGAFVNRVEILFDDSKLQVAGLRFYCATPTLTRSGSAYTLSAVAITPAPFGSFIADTAITTGTAVNVNCAGIGLRAIVKTRGRYDPGSYVGMYAQCGLATGVIQPDNTLKITVAAIGTETGYDYGAQLANVSGATWTCNNNEVLIGWKGIVSGSSIDQLQAICAALAPQYKL